MTRLHIVGRLTSSEGRLPESARASDADWAAFTARINGLYGIKDGDSMTDKTIWDFHGDDVWRDDDGTVWVRQSQLVEALEWNRRAIAARALDDAADAWIPDEQDGLARWFDFVPDRLRARAARVRSGELKA